MPFSRPTLAALITRVQGDLRGRLSIGGPLLRRAMADILGTVWGGAVHTLYGYLDWLSRQLFGDTAEFAQLTRMAALYGLTPVPAAFATGNVTATGTNGTVIPAGTILQLDSVTSYSVNTAQAIAGGVATLPVTSVLAGAAANVPIATTVTFQTPIAGVTSTATVATGGIAGGVDAEALAPFRSRYLLRLQAPPQGGANQDYIAWTLAALASVTRAWVFPSTPALGSVTVYFVEDGNSIFPVAGDVAVVQAALNAQRPITAAVTALAPTNLAVAFTIHIVPDNTANRAAVTASLAALMTLVAQPGDGISLGTILLSQISTAIGNTSGVTDFSLTVPAANVVPGAGALPTVGVITWV